MSLEPEKIYLHDPHGVFDEDGHNGMETVLWSEDRIDENDYEYVRTTQNLPKANAYSLLGEVLKIIDELYANKVPLPDDLDYRSSYLYGYKDALNDLKERILSISPLLQEVFEMKYN